MFYTRMGRVEVETHHSTIPDMDSSQNGSIEVPIKKTHLKWKIVKIVDLIGRIWFKVCG